MINSEDFEGFTGSPTTYIGTSNGTSYEEAFTPNEGFVAANYAGSANGPVVGSLPTGNHGMVRSYTGDMQVVDALALSTGGYSSVHVDFAILIDLMLYLINKLYA